MTFLKNIQFTHLIKINGYQKEFNFRKSNGNLKTFFTVDTIDNRGDRIVFNMHDSGSGWKITQTGMPEWIMENESNFNESINKELAVQEIYFVRPESQNPGQFTRFFQRLGLSS